MELYVTTLYFDTPYQLLEFIFFSFVHVLKRILFMPLAMIIEKDEGQMLISFRFFLFLTFFEIWVGIKGIS